MGENGLLEKVKYAITSNSTVKGLMNDFKDAGINAKDELEAVILAEEFWWEINRKNNENQDYSVPAAIGELPYSKAKIGNTAYYIHGILHDYSRKKMILSRKARDFIYNQISKYHMPDKGIDYLCEYGFPELFGLSKEKEIIPYLYYIKKSISLAIMSRSPLNKNETCFWKGIDEKQADIIYKATRDINYLPLFRSLTQKLDLPMPLRMEFRKIKIEKQNRCLKCRVDIACHPVYSEVMTKHIIKFAERNRLKELHVLTGRLHEEEIVYYLNMAKN